MILNKYIYGVMVGGVSLLASCSDFLDTAPDIRAEIVDVEAARMLMVDAYAAANYGVIGEMYSDNIVDNNAPHISVNVNDFTDRKDTIYYNLPEWDKMYNELFAFQPTTLSSSDSPAMVWSEFYRVISVVNHALQNLDRIESEGNLSSADKAKADAVRGEALISRAYHHFILVNLFSQAYKNPEDSKYDIGIPYVTEPEKDLIVHYERGTVAEVYENIEKDLVKGLPLIKDAYYKVPKYHFNQNAAYAFAVRFYLFKRDYQKVIEYANKILGETPGQPGLLRDYKGFAEKNFLDDAVNEWIRVDSPSNLLIMSTYSQQMRCFLSKTRYAMNHSAGAGAVNCWGPTWSLYPHPAFIAAGLMTNGGQEYGMFSTKTGEKFEYTDKVSGIGYAHIIRLEFTKEEVLLSRAEAFIMTNQIDNAVADLKAWDENMKRLPTEHSSAYKELTREVIEGFYGDQAAEDPAKDAGALNRLDFSNTTKMAPDFIVTPEIKPYLNCCLHFRRMETVQTGMRFFDLKRFGIEWSHAIGKKVGVKEPLLTDTLKYDDVRRAVEVPLDALSMGLESSHQKLPRPTDTKMLTEENLVYVEN